MPSFTLIVAATLGNGIGHGGHLPWHIPRDMAYFARVTSNAPPGTTNAVIMGRHTWESIPPKFRPLKGRTNVIVSSNSNYLNENPVRQGATAGHTLLSVQPSLEAAIASTVHMHRTFIIGGASIYKAALDLAASSADPSQRTTIERILMTRISSPAFEECEVFFPEFRNMKASDGSPLWTRLSHEELEAWIGSDVPEGKQEENGIVYEFQLWTRKALHE